MILPLKKILQKTFRIASHRGIAIIFYGTLLYDLIGSSIVSKSYECSLNIISVRCNHRPETRFLPIKFALKLVSGVLLE